MLPSAVPALACILFAALAGCTSPPEPTIHEEPPAAARDCGDGTIGCGLVASGLERPLLVIGDGQGRTFVLEQGGRITDMADGSQVLDLSNVVSTCAPEEGLLSAAFAPDFPGDPYVYIAYTRTDSCIPGGADVGDLVLARHEVQGGMILHEGEELLAISQPYRNHNGAHLLFDADGMLLMSVGDGGLRDDPGANGQNPRTLLGTILRMDVSGQQPHPAPDNPFGSSDGHPLVWAYGLRNPWRMSLDPESGDLWVGDVGQDCFEEVTRIPAGEGGHNLGWNIYEGGAVRTGACQVDQGPSPGGFLMPEWTYRLQAGHCTVVMGPVLHAGPMAGHALAGDFCSGHLWKVPLAGGQGQLVMETGLNIASFGTDDQGNVYIAHHGGEVYLLQVT